MIATVDLDDDLLAAAQRLMGLTDPSTLIAEGLRVLIQRESAQRLVRLAGTEPETSTE